ncbi:hypothetical protein [Pseudobdellovibrio exovorus]|uniref:N-acetyltransferase domain-containing protein n=1 Tax=Pseudobdellovibrio exovorus JSS TaxID=1184267 RepID=M4VBD9_9BACT|nr:hypothetical protein [Pseudobdellovibrio exovorus]AGH96513.1 hypothetical protein A11Q_2297 [Pseudobdellovibrio exovorus JSS]
MQQVTYRIAQLADVENVFNYEYKKQFSDDSDEIENQIKVWDSFFRKEALEHYFKMGWSFLAFDANQNLVGFFMGQPLLFLDKQTQSLWVEYVSANNDQIYTELVDIAYRLSREKHFQKVLFSKDVQTQFLTQSFPFKEWERDVIYLKTTK